MEALKDKAWMFHFHWAWSKNKNDLLKHSGFSEEVLQAKTSPPSKELQQSKPEESRSQGPFFVDFY